MANCLFVAVQNQGSTAIINKLIGRIFLGAGHNHLFASGPFIYQSLVHLEQEFLKFIIYEHYNSFIFASKHMHKMSITVSQFMNMNTIR
jgi:hypothetical protein